MPRNVTVTFADGSSHVYQNVPEGITPEQVTSRASQEFGKQVTALDGGRESGVLGTVIDKAKLLAGAIGQGYLGTVDMIKGAGTGDPRLGNLNFQGRTPQSLEAAREPQAQKIIPTPANEPAGDAYLRAAGQGVGG